MWHAEAFNLARKAQNVVFFTLLFMKISFVCVKTLELKHSKKIGGPPWDLSCAPSV
jgi:hypothetical protein